MSVRLAWFMGVRCVALRHCRRWRRPVPAPTLDYDPLAASADSASVRSTASATWATATASRHGGRPSGAGGDGHSWKKALPARGAGVPRGDLLRRRAGARARTGTVRSGRTEHGDGGDTERRREVRRAAVVADVERAALQQGAELRSVAPPAGAAPCAANQPGGAANGLRSCTRKPPGRVVDRQRLDQRAEAGRRPRARRLGRSGIDEQGAGVVRPARRRQRLPGVAAVGCGEHERRPGRVDAGAVPALDPGAPPGARRRRSGRRAPGVLPWHPPHPPGRRRGQRRSQPGARRDGTGRGRSAAARGRRSDDRCAAGFAPATRSAPPRTRAPGRPAAVGPHPPQASRGAPDPPRRAPDHRPPGRRDDLVQRRDSSGPARNGPSRAIPTRAHGRMRAANRGDGRQRQGDVSDPVRQAGRRDSRPRRPRRRRAIRAAPCRAAARALRSHDDRDVVLDLAGVDLVRDGRTILDGIDWRVRAGERWVVVGPNGSGKTTLCRLASLYVHPTAGARQRAGAAHGTLRRAARCGRRSASPARPSPT